MSTISLYPVITDVKNAKDISIDTFLQHVKDGQWQDQIIKLRVIVNKSGVTEEEIGKAKRVLPYVTISGTFKHRNLEGLQKHSGYIAIDIDKLENLPETFSNLILDNYIHALFRSCTERGLCAIIKINPKSHSESFNFLSEYFFSKYNINIDESCKDVCRARYVTYDPDIYINDSSQLCAVKPEPKRKPAPVVNYVFQENDFTEIINQVQAARIDLTNDYEDWIKIGLALAGKFGEQGRDYFHAFSQYNENYSPAKTDKKYTHLLKSADVKVTIGTIYYLAKNRGLNIYSPRTQNIIRTVRGINRVEHDTPKIERVKRSLREIDGFTEDEIEQSIPLVNQILSEPISGGDENLILDIKIFIKQNYSLKHNEISQNIELDGVPITNRVVNSIYIHCRTYIPKCTFELVKAILFSDFINSYNAFLEFFKSMKELGHEDTHGHILKLVKSIQTDTPNADLFIRKWFVSIISCIHYKHSHLMLVLCGEQSTGKTPWFRQLLPVSLKKYYAESKLDKDKDDEILMTKKVMIMDDEWGGKSKKDAKKTKGMSSKETFSVRVPYGHVSEDLLRLAILCGTSNELDVLHDDTGNKRILPINTLQVDWAIYNSIDKDKLLYEAYLEYKSGYDCELSKSDVALLKDSTEIFKQVSTEEEMIFKYYGHPAEYPSKQRIEVTNTEILLRMQAYTSVRINTTKLGIILKNLGFVKTFVKIPGTRSNKGVYTVVEL